MSWVMIYCTIAATSVMLLLDALAACTDRPVFWIFCCGSCCCTRCRKFSQPSVVSVVADIACLGAVQLRRTVLVRWTWRATSSQRIPLELVVLFSFTVLLSHGCSLSMDRSLCFYVLWCNCSSFAYVLQLSFQSIPCACGYHRTTNSEAVDCSWPRHG
jgi:hypothetical protein